MQQPQLCRCLTASAVSLNYSDTESFDEWRKILRGFEAATFYTGHIFAKDEKYGDNITATLSCIIARSSY